jgi:hypothetical protein
LASLLMSFVPLGAQKANAVAATVVWGIPGIFGFLAWELKENWRVYASNRPCELRPVVIGQHGETLVRFLRRGFHSGTLPKLFARLRHADRKAYATGRWSPPRKLREKLHHVAESVRHFVERDFLALLQTSDAWNSTPLSVGDVLLGANNIRVEVRRAETFDDTASESTVPPDSLWIIFEEQAGWLVAGATSPLWLDRCSPPQLERLNHALDGLFKMSGVDLLREQLETALRPTEFEVCEQGLTVWTDASRETGVIYNLREGAVVPLPGTSPSALLGLRLPEPERLVFAHQIITWSDWVRFWESEQKKTESRETTDTTDQGMTNAAVEEVTS